MKVAAEMQKMMCAAQHHTICCSPLLDCLRPNTSCLERFKTLRVSSFITSSEKCNASTVVMLGSHGSERVWALKCLSVANA